MPFVQANGLEFYLEIKGQGPRLLFIGGTSWDLRQHPNPLDSQLVESFEVMLYDQRGMGRSAKPDGPYLMTDYADDAASLMIASGWKDAHVVGYSFGGMVAQELAIGWPQHVRSLVLAATTSGGQGGSSYPIEEFLPLSPYERARSGLEVADQRFTKQWQREHPVQAEERILKRVARQTEFINVPGMRASLVEQMKARADHDAYQRLRMIRAPVLILSGKHDGQAPLDAQQRMAGEIPQSEHCVLEGAHDFIFEGPDGYRAITEFCKKWS